MEAEEEEEGLNGGQKQRKGPALSSKVKNELNYLNTHLPNIHLPRSHRFRFEEGESK
jgi:hypothetical protein